MKTDGIATFYEPKIPLRWRVRTREVRVQSPRSLPGPTGVGGNKFLEQYRVLQWWNDSAERWEDVPEVKDE